MDETSPNTTTGVPGGGAQGDRSQGGEAQGGEAQRGEAQRGGAPGSEAPGSDGRSGAPAGVIDIKGILTAIPHRHPFLLIDRVVDVVLGESATGIKNVSANEPFFAGHFPNHPVMPGVLIIECMAQTSAVLVVTTLGPEAQGKIVYFMSIDMAKFRRPVMPGDQLRIEVSRKQQRGQVWKFQGYAKVDGRVVAEAVYSAMIMDRAPPLGG
jgi:3-hydroxyacyl-[acyl-carrier-protein] dehydratase